MKEINNNQNEKINELIEINENKDNKINNLEIKYNELKEDLNFTNTKLMMLMDKYEKVGNQKLFGGEFLGKGSRSKSNSKFSLFPSYLSQRGLNKSFYYLNNNNILSKDNINDRSLKFFKLIKIKI